MGEDIEAIGTDRLESLRGDLVGAEPAAGTAFSPAARASRCDAVGGAALARSAGRLRSEAKIAVGTKAGQSTDTPIRLPASFRSWYSVSLAETTAALLAL